MKINGIRIFVLSELQISFFLNFSFCFSTNAHLNVFPLLSVPFAPERGVCFQPSVCAPSSYQWRAELHFINYKPRVLIRMQEEGGGEGKGGRRGGNAFDLSLIDLPPHPFQHLLFLNWG